MFEVNGWTKYAEEDVFAEGCVGRGASFGDNNMRFQGSTLQDLIKSLMEFTGVDHEDCVVLDACDEEGRIDIQLFETAEGNAASYSDIEKWRDGELRLWLVDYTFRVEQVERRRVALAA